MRKLFLIIMMLPIVCCAQPPALWHLLASKSQQNVISAIDPSFNPSGWTLSGGNLITTTTTFGNQRSNKSHSSGKWYFEVKYTAMGSSANALAGLLTPADVSNSAWPGKASNYGIEEGSTTTAQGISNSVAWPGTTWSTTFAQGDIIGFAVDLNGLTISIYKNGVLITPSGISIAAGTYYAACGVISGGSGTFTFTFNFGATSFAISGGAPPAGYSAW